VVEKEKPHTPKTEKRILSVNKRLELDVLIETALEIEISLMLYK
jgi:hypothetical protein